MAWDFSTEPEFEEKLEWMRTFVREEVWPIEAIQHDIGQAELDRIYAPLQQQVREQGLWAAHLPPELGGQGFGQVKLGLMNEILGTSIFAPNAFGCQAPDSGNSEILALAGTPEQKERWLYPLLNGELRSAFSMTEPGHRGLRPDAAPHARRPQTDGGYVLDGHKWFTSNGSIADFLVVMAVTDPDAAPHERASMFLVPVDDARREPRPRRRRTWSTRTRTSGCSAATPRSSTRTSGCRPDALLGKEGEGFLIAQHRLVPGRIHHCMRWLGVARRAFDMLCERSLYREVRGGLLKDKQTVQNWIADSAAEMQAARLMTLHAAWKIDMFGSSAARTRRLDDQVLRREGAARRVDRALQAHGGLGYSTDMPLEMLYRYARHARFVDGADEVHRETVARQILQGVRGARGRHPDRARADPPRCTRSRSSPTCSTASLVEMRAVQLVRWQAEPELREIEVPEPAPGEVLVKILGAGLCHSDLHVMEWPEGTLPWTLPFTLGHENAGTVAALGDGVTGFEIGDAVLIYGPWGCGSCQQCARGAENLCLRAAGLAGRGCGLGFDGGLADYLVVPSPRLLVPIGDLDPAHAAPLDRCCAVALQRDQA